MSKFLWLAFAWICMAGPAHAATTVVYVNGIQNTVQDWLDSRQRLSEVLNESRTRVGSAKRTFTVTSVYNPIGFAGEEEAGCSSCDRKEIFILKTAEELFFEDFRRLQAPHNASTTLLDREAASRIKQRFVDDLTPGPSTNELESLGLITDRDLAPTRAVINSIVVKMKQQGERIFVAHSQGNLLLNLAWAAYVADVGQGAASKVRIVNVANNSRFAVSNLDLSHEGDIALRPLLVNLASIVNSTRSTPDCRGGECDFQLAPSTFGGGVFEQSLENLKDLPRHNWIRTYLSENQLPNILLDQGVLFTGGRIAFRDRLEDIVYAAADSLDSPQELQVVSWTSSTLGQLGSISVNISTSEDPPSTPRLFDGPLVARIFGSGLFSGPVSLLVANEIYGKSLQRTNTYTVTFSAPVTDVRVHLGSLASVVTFSRPITKLSGQDSFQVAGSTVTGAVNNSGSLTDSNGTIGLQGTLTTFTFSTVGLPNVGAADGIAMQIAARAAD